MTGMTGLLPGGARAAVQSADFWARPRYVRVARPWVREEVAVVYWESGRLIQEGYQRLSWILRDVRLQRRVQSLQAQGKRVPSDWHYAVGMSVTLLDILYAIGGWLDIFGLPQTVYLTDGSSGYRNRVTNGQTEGAALNSRHIAGGAADIRIPGVSPASVAEFGLWLRAGGVGFYPSHGFTHVDDGGLRFWRG